MQSTSFNVGQSETVTLLPEDPNNNPGLLGSGNIPSWAIDPSSPQTGLAITPASNGLSAKLSATVPGTYLVDVSGQNSAGGGFTSQFSVTINEQPATQFAFQFGTAS
jgi:hypothetical protein